MRKISSLLNGAVSVAILLPLMYPAALTAQSKSGQPKFDIKRMADSEGQFQTFHVTETQALRQALDAGILKEDTRVLVTQTAAGKLALLADQMSYHHIAQGRAGGKDWMVTF